MHSGFAVVAAALMLAGRGAQAQGPAEEIARGDSAEAAFDPAEALRHYEAAIAVDSMSAAAFDRAARSAVDIGEATTASAPRKEMYRKAERYARRAVALDPESAEARFNLARAIGRMAQSVGVKERVKYAVEIRTQALEALRIQPDHPGALHVLGVWNAEVMRLNGFERFFAEHVLGGGVLHEASWEEAVKNLERSVAVDPERLAHHLDLGKIYLDIREKAKAREQFDWVVKATKRTDANDPLYKTEAAALLKKLS